jgi:hypothetical protein
MEMEIPKFSRTVDMKGMVEWIKGMHRYFDCHEIKDHIE